MRKISLNVLLSSLVSVSVLMTLTIMIISSYTTQKRALIDNTLSNNYVNAVQMSQTLDSLFLSMQSSLKYAAKYIHEDDFTDTSKLNTSLDLIQNSSNFFNSVALADQTGLVRSISPYYESVIGKHVNSKAAKLAIQSKASYISEAYPTPQTNHTIMFIGEPLNDASGNFIGMIGGNIHLQEYNILNLSFGNQLQAENGSYFFIVDQKGTLLFHPNANRIGENVSRNDVVRKLLNNQEGKERYKNISDVDSLAAYYKVPTTSWGVVFVTPTQTVYDQLNHHIWMLLLYTSIPFLILTLVVLRVARKLASPFVLLADMITQMENGEVNQSVVKPHWNREADLLTRTVIGAMRTLKQKTDQLVYQAGTDVLTGLNNRRTFGEIIQQWTQREGPFSIIVLDIDRFKTINDTFGHHAGDEVLKRIAQQIQMSVSSEDFCFRYGGEEFVVLLQNCRSDQAYETAESIRLTVQNSTFTIDHSVTISAGIAEYPVDSSCAADLFQLADAALYQAKEEGRNRTIVKALNNE
ncbi:sensor domain-containing diguanylate cyclase [Paenibacillus sp. MER 99-2]|uniref:sensor domain-containing diguanylate cyclase n=1 Tax=Paenibacillus sp. MER 99-2 TaxID=2939572 RepID=UPI00203B7DA1|nr:sensor domain-containing diguanylate cyclase [Paenibacillus sp. MER 99-2]MCM3172286.1 sensor domain-containing diguanylate cyclase [Paenibacillus sp. MER 99-2]